MATLSDFSGDESFIIGGNSFNNRESSGTPIYERTGGGGDDAIQTGKIARAVFASTGGLPATDSIHKGTTSLATNESYRDVRPSSFNIKDSTYLSTSTGTHYVHFITPIENPVIIVPDFQWGYDTNTGQANISSRITTYANTSPLYNLTFDSQDRLTRIHFSGTISNGVSIGLAIRHFVVF